MNEAAGVHRPFGDAGLGWGKRLPAVGEWFAVDGVHVVHDGLEAVARVRAAPAGQGFGVLA
ncbi:MAG: hypothetical protein ACRDNS_29325, partial [Trebonia sp.]